MSRLLKWHSLALGVFVLIAWSGIGRTTDLAPTTLRVAALQVGNEATPTATLMPTASLSVSPSVTLTLTATLASTTALTTMLTATPAPTPSLSSESCVACHTDQVKLEEIAVDTTVKSEETTGEG